MAYWGIALSLRLNPHIPPPKDNLALGFANLGESEIDRCQDPARARLYRRSPGLLRRSRQRSAWQARASLSQGDGSARRPLSRRRRSPDRLRDHAERRGVAERQDLCQPAQGRGHSGADLPAPAAPSGSRALSDPPLRLPGDLPRRGLDAAKRYAAIAPAAPHAQHMPSHIFTRVGYWKESIASNAAVGARRQRPARNSTTSCTPWIIWSTPIFSWRRTSRPARSWRRWSRSRATIRTFAPDRMRSRPVRPAT